MELVNTPDGSLLTVESLTKRFFNFVALDSASFSVHKGRCVALLGENGAGKSTLIKTLAGINKKTSGKIVFKGDDIEDAAHIATSGKTPIAFIHQDLGLIEWMTVAENIGLTLGFPKRFGLINWKLAEKRAKEVLALVGLDIKPSERIFNLSAAEKSLLAIARALVADAELLVLDEPLSGLDQAAQKEMLGLFSAFNKRGGTIVMVEHNWQVVIDYCHQAYWMEGELKANGSPAEVLKNFSPVLQRWSDKNCTVA